MRLICCVLYLFCSVNFIGYAQPTDSLRLNTVYTEVGGVIVGGKNTPFWLRANQYGIVPLSGSVGTVRVGAYSDYRAIRTDSAAPKPRRFDWGYGINVVANGGTTSQFILPEAYAKVRFHKIELYVGRRREVMGLVDTTLSSGAYSWSGNALPIPKIQIGTVGYAPIKFTKGLIAFNAMFSHGWFNDGYVRNSYLHQKFLYGRLGKPNWRVKLYAGFTHQVQWGGYAPGLAGVPGLSENGQLPTGLKAYWNVVTTQRGADPYTDRSVISIDEGNRIGNHLGSFDGAVEFNIGSYQVMAYRQFLYETGALYYLTSIKDGLNGIRFKRRRPSEANFSVDHFLIEYFYSKSQGGSEFIIEDPKRRGRTDNFNHSQYKDGWTYLGRTIGNPFLSQASEVRSELRSESISNNRVSLIHLAASGTINQQIAWLLKLSFSQNYGTYNYPYPDGTNQFSGLLQVGAPITLPALGACQLNASLALDQGKLLYNSTGVYLGIRKTVTNRPVNRSAAAPIESRMLRQ